MKTQPQEQASSSPSLHHSAKGRVATVPKRLLRITVPFALAAGLCASAALAWDDDNDHQGSGAVKLLTTIPVPPVKANTSGVLKTFDISWVDANTRRYFLADRSNQAIDVINTQTNKVVDQIPANPPFAGASGNNNTSGPNGVTVSGRWLFASDCGKSSATTCGTGGRVVTIDLSNGKTVSDVSTGGKARADEIAYDPHDGILIAINNADDPPFATLISVNKSTGALTVGKSIIFDQSHAGFDATNGAEQPVWDAGTGKFYLSIPEVNCPPADTRCGGGFPDGAVVRIDPHSTGAVEALYPVKFCQPAGLTLGPNQDLLVGCSQAFDTAGNAWSLANPLTASPPAVTAAPVSIIIDAKNGSIDKTVKGVSGNDEVWFNAGDGRYYLAARNQPGGPVLGVIDAKSQKLLQLVPTVNQASTPKASPQAGSAHSVAADLHNNHVFVPLPTNNVFPNCLTGCVAVFGVPKQKHDD
ncbi:MAG TPA: hypothetical protein VML91_17930 [Burkholderiales bacterium]|nr:hypothetical protein [Burkholderiales bacterium]